MLTFKQLKIKRLLKKIKNLQQTRTHNAVSDNAIKKEIQLYFTLADIYKKKQGHKKYPFSREKMLECYRAAAAIEDSEAQYNVGMNLLEEAKFRDKLQQDGIFSNRSNERQMLALYEEAFAYLKAAEQQNHIQAIRLHGLSLINSWGVKEDNKAGFELIVESINLENSWDKVAQIFSEIGLNKPEFYSQLTHMRNKTT